MLHTMKTRAICLTAALLLTALGLTAGCDPGRGSIQGIMMEEDGTPIANGIVRAETGGYPALLLRADRDGCYNLTNIYAGEWQVEFFNEGGLQVGLETCAVRAGETATLDFTIGEHPLPDGFIQSRLLDVPAS
ncbi:MAG: carboxypeptidase regulatory-like domain-containing protein [Dehalococcoidia bacterium]|nr:carboxypeptidase regulatory-like domain-containing protein [Dehalococcoidia bacterium]